MSTCPTGKVRYRDKIAAMLALAKTGQGRHTRRPKEESRAYRCPRCRGWHLTSMPDAPLEEGAA